MVWGGRTRWVEVRSRHSVPGTWGRRGFAEGWPVGPSWADPAGVGCQESFKERVWGEAHPSSAPGVSTVSATALCLLKPGHFRSRRPRPSLRRRSRAFLLSIRSPQAGPPSWPLHPWGRGEWSHRGHPGRAATPLP